MSVGATVSFQRRISFESISAADANGRDNIGSEDEANALWEEWTVHNNGVDAFVVRTISTDDFIGLSPVGGNCDKDEKDDALLAGEIEKVMAPVAKPLEVTATPFVILVSGVNGSGKTTTIGKMSARFRAQGKTVMLVAADTFRAAAIDQLKIWAERTGASVVARTPGADPAGLAFDAVTQAKADGTEVVLIDTAGRLQNRAELMNELEKVVRVIRKVEPTAPHAVLLVLDATVGQNALSQVEIFGKTAGATGPVMPNPAGPARGSGAISAASGRSGTGRNTAARRTTGRSAWRTSGSSRPSTR